MDPEDLREVISAYQKCVSETVPRFGGFVAKYMGDGVLVYFGYPQAHEDDAERAVRAGLELVARVCGLKTHTVLQTRIGIATGLVVVGDLIGAGASQEQAIVGETPNLVARLQGIAEPNSVVIADSTRKLVGNLFELDDLGASDLKGMAGPVRVWVALRPSSVESRFEALHASGLTELVGREEELELLLRRWSKAKSGEGQVVLLSGEPGIGKSRLTAALMERLATEPHIRLRYFCSPQHTDSALYPIVSQMERAAGFKPDDTPQAKLDKFDVLLAKSFTPREDAALLAEMLSLPNDGRYPNLELEPQQRRQGTLEALNAQIGSLAEQTPVLMIFEDVHWIDPTSLEALGRGIGRNQGLGALLIITYRPEFEPPWTGQPHVTSLTLNRLPQREIATLIDRMRGNKPLPESITQDIIERTDGIPLFVEEMTKAVLEGGEPALAAIPSPSIGVPASLHASLMARLDRLGSAKEIMQIGAVIGREFSHTLLAAVARTSEAELQWALDRVTAAGLLFRQGVPPNATYLFKHALLQDAAYGTLLREPRRALHARIAETLERQVSEIAQSQPELLARHYTESGLIEKATGFWLKAGQRSLSRSALVEAIEQFKRALSQFEILPATPALRREEIKAQVALITPLMHVKGYAATDTKEAVERARLLIEQADERGEPLEDPLLLFSVLYGLWIANVLIFNADVCRDQSADALTLAQKQGDTASLLIAHRMEASSLLFSGEVAKSQIYYDRALTLYDPEAHRSLATRFGQDARVSLLIWRSLALWLLGYPERGLSDADDAIGIARTMYHAPSLMLTLSAAPLVYNLCGNYSAGSAASNELAALATEKRSFIWKISAIVSQGWQLAISGKASDAVRMIATGLAGVRSTGMTLTTPYFVAILALAYSELNQPNDASRCINEAISAIETTKERWVEAEVNRIAGEIAMMAPEQNAAKAQSYFERALSVARQQQAKSWELRAAMSLARLWRDQGRVREARELLAPVYGWFTEGFDTRDLKEAKALLEELAA
jgi:predicted ATPase/class 3 adenylate cyclase